MRARTNGEIKQVWREERALQGFETLVDLPEGDLDRARAGIHAAQVRSKSL